MYADSNNKIGKNTKNNKSGVSLKSSIKEKNPNFDNGINTIPIITSNTV